LSVVSFSFASRSLTQARDFFKSRINPAGFSAAQLDTMMESAYQFNCFGPPEKQYDGLADGTYEVLRAPAQLHDWAVSRLRKLAQFIPSDELVGEEEPKPEAELPA
jgi:hypothetical protein